ncbi:MAG: glucoamylase family protein [Thermodesulfobacteriota bacterium]
MASSAALRVPRPLLLSLVLAALPVLVAGVGAETGGGPEPAPTGVPADAPRPTEPCPVQFTGSYVDGAAAWHEIPVVAQRKRAWEQSVGGKEAARPLIRARLRGWPARLLVERNELPSGERAFLERLARDAWRGLDALSDRENGLPVDNVAVGRPAGAPSVRQVALGEGAGERAGDGTHVGDYTNVTNIGLGLVAIVGAQELGMLSREEAVARTSRILDTLDRLETHRGYFFNFYDTTSLERTSNFLSFVDLAWLTTGLVVARRALPEVAERATKLVDRMDFGFFYDRKLGQISHGYYVNREVLSRYHYGVLFTEARLGVLLAIGKGDVPEDAWFRMARIFPRSCEGQTLEPRDVRRVSVQGRDVLTGLYEWGGFRYVPSWGGSMFEALMPTLVLDELRYAPRSLGENGRVHAAVQERYAATELRYPTWGLSPSASPDSDGYLEYGARVLGARGYRAGALTPHAAALALAVRPAEAAAALRRFADEYPMYGEYGLYDAVDPTTREVAYRYLAVDQSMLFIALANHLTGGALQRHFASDGIVARALPLIADESFFP